ncbi:MAG: sigma-70 family RNA polymerase sigma factor [Thermoleophilia bacterium]|nr:sigma-70 family RNA polymerase sigma factor [Thermoleophilia bacterium]
MANDPRMDELEALYRDRHSHFVRVARALVGSPEAAHDVVQDAFAAAVRSRHDFRGEGPLEAWLWRILVNRARATSRERPTAGLVGQEAASARRNGAHAGNVLAAVAALPERQRLAVFLRYYADLDYRSIAAALGVEVGTVSATLHAAHAALRRLLTEEVTG